MKKFLGILAIAGVLVACDNTAKEGEAADTTTVTTTDTTTVTAPMTTDTMTTITTDTTTVVTDTTKKM